MVRKSLKGPLIITCCKGTPPLAILQAAAKAFHDNLVHGGGPSYHRDPGVTEMEHPIAKPVLGGQRPARRKKK